MTPQRRRAVWDALVAGLATAASLAGASWLVGLTDHQWLLASFGGSAVILFGRPQTDMAQPRSFFGGHALSTAVGLVFLHFGWREFGGSFEAWMIAAVALSLALMMLTRTVHSPAGANPIVIFMEGARWSFVASPLAIGLVALFITALVVNNRRSLREAARYPREWL